MDQAPGPPTFRAVNLQGWLDLTFLHWTYPPEVVQALLPQGLTVETVDGRAWVGVVPFRMHAVRTPGLPPLPHLSSFPELNCRTYVRHANGTSGVWFFSLDATRLWIVAAARVLGLPYMWCRGEVDGEAPGTVRYRSDRLVPWRAPVRLRAEIEVGAPVDTDDLTRFLSARWWAFSRRAGRLWQVPVAHPDWSLHEARAVVVDVGDVLGAAGLPAPTGAPLVHFSPGVRTRLGLPRPS
ncbi:YqjF family protein [Oceanitalea stevensii]|uniref:DUF2071 domain-containing protein n=1 Tax=Oceanitalea stevensii TaxID=2763072 RepID=A0ABR8Z4N3_9MICO|nr:DUF2071 domain-containing protein [Oceanitalea stevensii]MBD8062759.1 DUF2071 domain-containing protein [Oceanitalea stevensii]